MARHHPRNDFRQRQRRQLRVPRLPVERVKGGLDLRWPQQHFFAVPASSCTQAAPGSDVGGVTQRIEGRVSGDAHFAGLATLRDEELPHGFIEHADAVGKTVRPDPHLVQAEQVHHADRRQAQLPCGHDGCTFCAR